MSNKRLYRIPEGKVFGGVCTGLGKYFDIDFTVVRLIWLLAFFLGGMGGLVYIIAWIVIPEREIQSF